MAKITVEKNRTTQLEVTTSNTKVIVEKGNVFNSQSNGIVESGAVSGNEFLIDGTVRANGGGNTALSFDSIKSSALIGDAGKLISDYWAVRAFGDNARIVNDGKIDGAIEAITLASDHARIVNTGTIQSEDGRAIATDQGVKLRLDNDGLIDSHDGLLFRMENLTLNFGKDSVVSFDEEGRISTNSADGWVARIHNEGEITNLANGQIVAIEGGEGRELIRNSGTITGFMFLEGGNDRYDGRGGRLLEGVVYGGDGNDTYLIDNAKDRIGDSIGMGFDTLKLGCSYKLEGLAEIEKSILTGTGDFKLTGNELDNWLIGNRGDNSLLGMAGSDVLFGGAGKDMLTGGAAGDVFDFMANADREIITDFTDGEDHLELFSGAQIKTIDDLLAHHVHQDGKDLVISGDGTEMILKNFDKADLTADDFVF